MVSVEGRAYYRNLLQRTPFGADGFDLEQLRQIMATRREPPPGAACCRTGEIPGEWVTTPDASPDVRLLYLHGGGYVSGAPDFYLAMAAALSAAAGGAVFLPDYRLAPEHPFPAGLEDCIAAHEWLRANGPAGPAPARATFIAGDSAGGGLTLAALLALRDRGLPLPAGAIPISAFADLTLQGDSLRSEDGRDPIMSPRCLPEFVRLYLGGADAREPLVSPVFGDYRGLPPLLIQVGEHEIIRDDSVAAAGRARASGVRVTLEVWEGMFHVFQSHDLTQLPEARQAIARIGEFIRALS